MQQSKNEKCGGQKTASSKQNGFDCKVLREEEREPDAGITLFGAAFGSSNYIRAHFKKFSAKVQDILAPSRK